MKVVAFAIAPVMMHRRHDWNTTAYAFRHRALQRGLPWKRRGRHDGFSMTSSVGSKAEEPYTAYLVQANTDRTSFTYILSFFPPPLSFSCWETMKHWRVKFDLWWNSWKKLEKDFKGFERIFHEYNTIYNNNFVYFGTWIWTRTWSRIWKIISVLLEKKKKIARSRKFISVLERVLSKIYQIVEIPATIFLVF